jgi:adenylylsulfate kinase
VTAWEAGEILRTLGVAHAVIDFDALRWVWPAPAYDRFQTRLGLQNLSAVWKNHRSAGATRLILAQVIENRDDLEDYSLALGGATVLVCQLTATLDTIAERIWHRQAFHGEGEATCASPELNRARELDTLLHNQPVGDYVVDTEGRMPTEIATDVLRGAEWL